MAKEFGVLPSQVRDDLDDDPEMLSLKVLPLLRYAEAHAAYRRANKSELKAWKDSSIMRLVERNDVELVQELKRGH